MRIKLNLQNEPSQDFSEKTSQDFSEKNAYACKIYAESKTRYE